MGTPFPLVYFLRLDTRNTDQLDFFSTAELTFDLPEGVTVTSVGGFTSRQTAVAEPSSVLLVSLGLVGLAAARWQRRWRAGKSS